MRPFEESGLLRAEEHEWPDVVRRLLAAGFRLVGRSRLWDVILLEETPALYAPHRTDELWSPDGRKRVGE